MNIFVVSETPEEAARMLCDQHVVKMILESFQLLATVLRFHGAPESCLPRTSKDTPFRPTHVHHPCAVWTRSTRGNFDWLVRHVEGLCAEYTVRYGKQHALERWIDAVRYGRKYVPDGPTTEFARAMPEPYKNAHTTVDAYRAYYRFEKAKFARWCIPERCPSWFSSPVPV